MAILECMVIEAKDGMIKLISNDLEIGIETIIEGDIKEPGSVAVNAKVFFEIIRKLPYNEVSISVNCSVLSSLQPINCCTNNLAALLSNINNIEP